MLIYNYHPDSGEFVGSSEAEASPFDDGEYLIPAFATTLAPPEQTTEGNALVFDGEAWGEVEDHRGETWWTAAGEPMTINKIGNPVDYELKSEPPPPPPALPVARLRFALVHDGIVVQTLEADCPMRWQLLNGCRMVVDEDALAQPGYSFDGKSFKPPEKADDAA